MPFNQKLTADLLNIVEAGIPAKTFDRNPALRTHFNSMKKSFGLEVQDGPLARAPAPVSEATSAGDAAKELQDQMTVIYSADLTQNPPKISTSDANIDVKNGSFNQGSFTFATNKVLQGSWTADMNAQSFLQPVFFNLTTTKNNLVNPVDVTLVFNGMTVIKEKSTKTMWGPDGVLQIPVSATFIMKGYNEYQFTVTSANNSVSVTKAEVATTDIGSDPEEQLKTLQKVLARLGAENYEIQQKWPKIISVTKKYPELNSLTPAAEKLAKEFTDLNDKMKDNARELQAFVSAYMEQYMQVLLSTGPDRSKELKLGLMKTIKSTVDAKKAAAKSLVDSLNAYSTNCTKFRKDLNDAAKAANEKIVKEVQKLQDEVTDLQKELDVLKMKETDCGVGVGLAVGIGGAVVATVATLAPAAMPAIIILTVISSIAFIISLACWIDLQYKVMNKATELANKQKELDKKLAEQKDIEDMLKETDEITGSIDSTAEFTSNFCQVWDFLDTQLTELSALIEKWNGDANDQPKEVEVFGPYYATQMQPYFARMNDLLIAYLTNFP